MQSIEVKPSHLITDTQPVAWTIENKNKKKKAKRAKASKADIENVQTFQPHKQENQPEIVVEYQETSQEGSPYRDS
jgi:hypothetical protein